MIAERQESVHPRTGPKLAGCTLALLCLVAACRGEQARPVLPGDVLLRPDDPAWSGPAPDTFRARFETSKGDFVVEVPREWAPQGADRFYHLVRHGFFDGVRFYRAIEGFMVQFGLHGDPAVTRVWLDQEIPDDPVRESNWRGRITFATAGPNTRTTELFINLIDNLRLDDSGFAPFGRVVEGMDVVDRLYTGYGETLPYGSGPDAFRIRSEGNAYLVSQFPQLDQVRRATIVLER